MDQTKAKDPVRRLATAARQVYASAVKTAEYL